MDNDEKLISHDDEPPRHPDADRTDDRNDHSEADAPFGIFKPMKEDSGHSDTAFRNKAKTPKEAGSDQDFGMPDLPFADNHEEDPAIANNSAKDALTAAKAGLVMPPREGTGWENVRNIERSSGSHVAANVSVSDALTQESVTQDRDEDVKSDHGEANVMPFPGNSFARPNEPEPSELLRGTEDQQETDLFGTADALETAEAVPDFDPSAHDSIADAVQSALKNVYGGRVADEEDQVPDLSGYTVAESLKRAAAAGDSWQNDDRDWPEDRQDGYFDAGLGARDGDSNTDAVLDYLYSGRRGSGRDPGEVSLRDFAETSGHDREWPEEGDNRSGAGGFEDAGGSPFRDVGGQYADYGDRGFPRDDSGFRDMMPNAAEWAQPPYVASSSARGMPEGQYPAPLANAAPESLAAGAPDSSHLLGAAGLGLIGGIALAGVLAVFVFNSVVVEESNPVVADTGAKVVERLAPPPVVQQQITEERSASPGITTDQAASGEPRTAALQVDPARTTQEPAPPAAVEPATVEPEPVEPEAVEPPAAASNDKLAAADITGEPGATVPLAIKLAHPGDPDATLVSLKGLPANAKLSTGIDVGGGQWLLPPEKLDELTITTPGDTTGEFSLEAQLLKDDAQTPLSDPVPFKLVVGDVARRSGSGTSRPPVQDGIVVVRAEDAAQLAEVSDGTPQIETDVLTQLLIRDGNKLMRDGDILGARRLYEEAAAGGNPEAALAMGRSFDPSYFEKLPVKTGKPDPATAFQWYKKALEGGLVTARVKIDGLKQWLQR